MALNPTITDWQGKRVWLIGASTGIGAALARALIGRGARVAASARNEKALAALVAGHKGALALPADVTDAESLKAAHTRIARGWHGLDVAIYLAGMYKPQHAWELTVADARAHVEANLMGVYHVLPLVIPGLVKQGAGAIALVSSVAGYRGLPQSLVYGPTKAALINLAEALYLDLAPKNVGVHVINPGFVETPMTARNAFPMPAIVSPEVAADEILKGFAAGEFEITFPKRFTRMLQGLRLLPYAAYFPAVKRATRP
jgi:NAD(P)-dependent dehydrogenase (short-subunit alcohol dehydrogenase family)